MHTLRDYGLPLLLAFGVHAGVALALSQGWKPPPVEPRVIEPHIVDAALLVMERPKSRPAPRPAPPPPTPKPKPEPTVVEPQKPKVDPLAEQRREREEAKRKRQREEEARQKRLNELADSAFEEALEREVTDLEDDEPASITYIDGIYRDVVANWSRPPSARNDMEAQLRVELIPTGEVVSVTVIASSGNTAFDRSAELAVRKARRFEVPDETRLFERHFRSFVLLFKPQDLLR